MNDNSKLITLEQAEELVALLKEGRQTEANNIVLGGLSSAFDAAKQGLFDDVGKLARKVHESIINFEIDEKLIRLAEIELPQAAERLSYVVETTEKAANKTMDAVEESLKQIESYHMKLDEVRPIWSKMMAGDISVGEFKAACHQIDEILKETSDSAVELKGIMNEVLIAQDYQDLTGQVIRKVIVLVQDIHNDLIRLLDTYSDGWRSKYQGAIEKAKEDDTVKAEGPLCEKNNENVVSSQDDVDDLLSSLGF